MLLLHFHCVAVSDVTTLLMAGVCQVSQLPPLEQDVTERSNTAQQCLVREHERFSILFCLPVSLTFFPPPRKFSKSKN